MDEHKKQMIQQWVEGQTMVHNTGDTNFSFFNIFN